MSKKLTNTEIVEAQRLKELAAFKLDRKAVAGLKKILDSYPGPEIATSSGALKSPLGDIKP